MSTRLLKRHLSTVQSLAPGQYTTETITGDVAVACPDCGGVSDLDGHEIDEDGAVTPEFRCPYVCAYGADLQLEDWGEAVLK